VETATFDGVTHGFDQQERSPVSALSYDARATQRALRIGRAWLDDLAE
jgi:dienelactone hydrolase